MKKNENIVINEKKLSPPDSLLGALSAADENDLRTLLLISLLADKEDSDLYELGSRIELSEGDINASLKFWQGAGILKKQKKTAQSSESAKQPSSAPSAHRGGKLEAKSELPPYSTAELAELIERRHVTTEFINEAERVVGKMFNTHDINILVGMVDYIGFDEASVIIILSHMAKQGKKSLRYAEQLAFSLYDEGITTLEALQEKLYKMEQYATVENQVKTMFGMTGRSLTTKEKKFLRAWIETMGYDIDCIRLAYDITVDATHSPAPAYANSILEKWYSEGLRSYSEIKAAEEAKSAAKKAEGLEARSFDTDEFFAAALKRTFDEP